MGGHTVSVWTGIVINQLGILNNRNERTQKYLPNFGRMSDPIFVAHPRNNYVVNVPVNGNTMGDTPIYFHNGFYVSSWTERAHCACEKGEQTQ